MTLLPLSDRFWQFSAWLNASLTPSGCLLTAAFLLCVIALIKSIRQYRMAVETSRLNAAMMPAPDMSAAAGEDVITAQLDLARAYIEMGNKDQAAAILSGIGTNGTVDQKQQASRLMAEVG